MSDNVIRLASSREKPAIHACKDCRFYEPDLVNFGTVTRIFSWRHFRFITTREPDATSHRRAVCSAVCYDACTSRSDNRFCGPEGRLFEKRSDDESK